MSAGRPKPIRLGTRGSPLALWQAEYIRTLLIAADPACTVELVPMTTTGDRMSGPLAAHGGKGLYVKELEEALLAGTIDVAVHSVKDLPGILPGGLALCAVALRADPRDQLLLCAGQGLEDLAPGARVGTASLRRQYQLTALRPDLVITPVRGNVATRLRKLRDGDYDALVMAVAGLKRLGCSAPVAIPFAIDMMIPAIGQGAIGVEGRKADTALGVFVRSACHHGPTGIAVAAERAVQQAVGGDCWTPLAAHADLVSNWGQAPIDMTLSRPLRRSTGPSVGLDWCLSPIALQGWLATPDGAHAVRYQQSMLMDPSVERAEAAASRLGKTVGEELCRRLAASS